MRVIASAGFFCCDLLSHSKESSMTRIGREGFPVMPFAQDGDAEIAARLAESFGESRCDDGGLIGIRY
jgi:hypothetical protein